jgi:hypothetical protein
MPEQNEQERKMDHDLLIRVGEGVTGLKESVKVLQDKIDVLMSDRAKLIGICVGVSGAVAVVIKVFWPGK